MNRHCNRWTTTLVILWIIMFCAAPIQAALNLPPGFFTHAGSDGEFAPTANVTVDLSLAPTAAWDSAGSGNGVYDPDKWAVVFKYSSVNIPAGVTVTFSNHPSRAPVVWLIDGDSTIYGEVILSGQNGSSGNLASEPGPGGFRGGYRYQSVSLYNTAGFGPGGPFSRQTGNILIGGSYGTQGSNGGPVYGNVRLLPLIGGSGGSGGSWSSYYTGGAGGGAILIVANGTLNLSGSIVSYGGSGVQNHACCSYGWFSGHGSGGAVRIVADSFGGTGYIATDYYGGMGRVRIEANNSTGTVVLRPPTDLIAPDDPVLIWPPAVAPSVKIISIGQVSVPDDPLASLEVGQTDIVIDYAEMTRIVLETRNVDTTNGTVQLRINYKPGDAEVVSAQFDSGTNLLATWAVEKAMPAGQFFTMQAIAKNPEPQN